LAKYRAMSKPAPHHLPVPARPGESLLGFLLRLAERNHVRDPIAFVVDSDLPYSVTEAIAFRASDLTLLARRAGVKRRYLEEMAYWPTAPGLVNFMGRELRREDVTVQHRRYCPKCLKSAPYHRAVWDLSVSTACIEHRVRLRDACSCGERLTWQFGTPSFCRCGNDLRDTSAKRLPKAELVGLAYVLGRLGMAPRTKGPDFLNALAPRYVIELLLGLGAFVSGERKRKRKRRIASLRDGDIHNLLNAGLKLCERWPDALFEAVSKYRSGRRYGLERHFGPVAAWMKDSHTSDEVRQVLLDAMAVHPDLRHASATRSKQLGAGDEGALMTLQEAQRALRRSHPKVRRVLLRQGHIVKGDLLGSGAPVLVNASAVWKLELEMSDLADKKRLRKELSVSRRGLDTFIGAGWLHEAKGPAAELMAHPVWKLSIARRLLQLMEQATQGLRVPKKFARMGAALSSTRYRAFDWRPGGFQHLWERCAWDPKASGLNCLLIDDALLRPKKQPGVPMTIPEVADRLKLKQEVVYHYCNLGLLKCRKMWGMRGRRVTEADVKAFQGAYIVPAHLGLDKGKHKYPGWASDQLIASGYRPVSGPGVDGGRQFLFRRRDVERSGLVV
jgi:hypothetical protein